MPQKITMSDAQRTDGGFTLVELLAVIAIILILAALLIPAASESLQEAKFVLCRNNVRQLGIATINFAGDNEGHMPSPNWGSATEKGWLYDNYQMDRPEHVRTGQLWPYLREELVYRCPMDPQPNVNDPYSVPWRPSNSHMITTYTINGSLCRFGGVPFDSSPARDGYVTYLLGQFLPTDIIFWENDELGGHPAWWDGANFPFEGLSGRHRRFAVVGCVDGHVERIERKLFYEWGAQNVKNRTWNVPDTPTGR
jgi:prepilin-type N-terminal cleavage/methylation domain-containing protein